MKLAVGVGMFGLLCSLSLYEGAMVRAYHPPVDTTLPPVVIELPDLEEDAMPLAVRNKNPLNVKGKGWKGQIGNDRQGHAIFVSYEYGVRAAAHVLHSYATRHNISTVKAIVERFAEKNTEKYVSFVCKALSVKPGQDIDVVRRLPDLLRVMSRFESGKDFPDELFIPYDLFRR